MEEGFAEEKVNSHTVGTGHGKELYRSMVETAKKIVFDDCLELLQYSSWLEKAQELKKLLENMRNLKSDVKDGAAEKSAAPRSSAVNLDDCFN